MSYGHDMLRSVARYVACATRYIGKADVIRPRGASPPRGTREKTSQKFGSFFSLILHLRYDSNIRLFHRLRMQWLIAFLPYLF